MLKKFSAKSQQLNPEVDPTSAVFSMAFRIDADSEDAFEKKGNIFVVSDIQSMQDLDTRLVDKVLHDVIHDTYYSSENVSPIQSLEKAIVEARNKISPVLESSLSVDSGFKLITSVLWGNVLYVVKYGEGEVYLMRDSEIKPITFSTEGMFSVASGIIKNEDVVVLCTKAFANQYPPEKLLSEATSISAVSLAPDMAGMLIRFDVESTFTEAEVVGIEPRSNVQVESEPTVAVSQEVTSISPEENKSRNFFKPLGDISDLKRLKINRPKLKKVSLTTALVVVLSVIFALSVLATAQEKKTGENFFSNTLSRLKGAISEHGNATESQLDGVNGASTGSVATETPEQQFSEEYDLENLITRVEPDLFYDLRITDSSINPTELEVLDNLVVVSEKSSGKLLFSNSATPRFDVLQNAFPGIDSLVYVGGDLSFNDTEGYKVFDSSSLQVVESYQAQGLGKTSTYLGYIYSLNEGMITRYTTENSTLNGVLWGQAQDFVQSKGFAISTSIYIVTQSNEIVRYTSGSKDSFETKGLDKPFSDIVDIVTRYDFDNVYVADKGEQRIVVLDKEGNLVKQIKSSRADVWSDIVSIGVSPNEDKLFVLDGYRVYEFDLK